MISLLLRPIFALILLTFAVIMIARVQPYDDGGLRATLFAKDCQPPCFMGIRPGITTKDEAARLLRAHPWVTNVRVFDDDPPAIDWDWSGQQPAFLGTYQGGHVVFLEAGIVRQIYLGENEPMGMVITALGLPDQVFATTHVTTARGSILFVQLAVYSQYQFAVQLETLCPVSPPRRWGLPVILLIPPQTENYLNLTLRRGFSPMPKACQ